MVKVSLFTIALQNQTIPHLDTVDERARPPSKSEALCRLWPCRSLLGMLIHWKIGYRAPIFDPVGSNSFSMWRGHGAPTYTVFGCWCSLQRYIIPHSHPSSSSLQLQSAERSDSSRVPHIQPGCTATRYPHTAINRSGNVT